MKSWMQTRDGHAVDLLAPDLSAVSIEEVAHALARINRFTGHTGYSVACHSVAVSHHVPQALRMWGLLHDAHEAFMGDISSPVKAALRDLGGGYALAQLDERLEAAVRKRWGLVGRLPEEVKQADLEALVTEKRDLFHCDAPRPWGVKAEPWAEETICLFHGTATALFLGRFRHLEACRARGECL